ncbi:PD-(D/E)XK nuclease family transposase, partial [[Clostridium] innocuum]|nr:PD-(D/E)XK nuclease family transposase [[Clostridium] innocuum]
GKRAVLDVVLEDETGHLYDLEMQVSGYTKEEQLRFQQYGYRLAGRQLKQGNDYTKLKPFYQIIFMNYKPKDTGRMIRHYTVKDEDNREEPNGTLHRAIVFLPMIRQRVKEVGGIENLTEFETFCYVLAYNPDDAILNMKRRMVNVAMKKYNEMREDGSLYSWAESVEFAQRAVQANLEEQTAEAEKSGLERGFKQGLQKGLDEGKRTLLQSLIVHKYGIEDEWVGSLSDQQMDDAVIQILDCDTYEALKERLKNKEMK